MVSTKETPKRFNIIIVGAGIAGLTAALSLEQKGHKVTVLERHADTQALGGPINMSPSASHILTQYGLKDKIFEQLNPQVKDSHFRRYADGSRLGSLPDGMMEARYGAPIWTCSRFGYQKVFRQAAEERGINVEFSAPIQTVDIENTTVVLRDGRRLQADLIVGADGIGSTIRPLVVSDHLERRNPVGAINMDVPLSLLQEDPDLAVLSRENQNFWMGPGGAFAGGAVRDLGVYNGVFTTEEKLGTQGEWFVKGDLDQIAKKYKDWDPRLLKLLKLVKPEDCYIWNITDLPPLPTWSKGRTVLIGDAAHATLPFMGLGATVSVEDGASLAECLDRAKSVEDIPRVLKAFENIRRPRAESMIELSRVSMSKWHLPDGEQQRQRDDFWKSRGPPKSAAGEEWDGKHVDVPPTEFTDPLLQPYFRGHKTVEFTNRKLDEMEILSLKAQ